MRFDPSLDVTMDSTLRNYSNDFFMSLEGDHNASKLFLAKLTKFTDTIRTHKDRLKQETLIAARNFSLMVDTISSSILELDKAKHNIQQQTTKELSQIISLSEKLGQLSLNETITVGEVKDSKHPAYIKPSYTWLLSNLHNPYPSKEFKKDISRQTNCSIKDIDAWFTDTRKRIGWNRLRKTKFSNKQENIVAAATHVFKPKTSSFSDDPSRTLFSDINPYDAFRADFLMIAQTARLLYAGRYPELHFPASSEDVRQTYVNAYPTPAPSPIPLAESPPPYSSQSPDVHPSISRKRSYSSATSENEVDEGRPTKRCRDEINQPSPTSGPINLPPPSDTVDLSHNSGQETYPAPFQSRLEEPTTVPIQDISTANRKRRTCDDKSDDESRRPSKLSRIMAEDVSSVIPSSTLVKTSKRKRRLSDSESQCTPKRPHNALVVPRLQTTSNPLPLTMPLNEDHCENWSPEGADLFDFSVTPLEANLEDPLAATLDVYQGRYDLPSHFESYLEDSNAITSNLIISESLDSSVLLSDLSADPLKDPMFDITINTASFIDSDFYSTTIFSQSHPMFGLDLQEPLSSSQWPPFSQPDNIYTTFCSVAHEKADHAHLGLANPRMISNPTSFDAKREKIRALNEQIRQLEAEL